MNEGFEDSLSDFETSVGVYGQASGVDLTAGFGFRASVPFLCIGHDGCHLMSICLGTKNIECLPVV